MDSEITSAAMQKLLGSLRATCDETTSENIPDPDAVMQLVTRPKSRRAI
jgi:hypothetical protein